MSDLDRDRKDTIHYNYQMMMAGKLRTFETVKLTKSPFDPSKTVMDMVEFGRLIDIVIKEVLSNDELLTLDELELMRHKYKLKRSDFKDLLTNGEIDNEASSRLKEFFKKYKE